MEGSLQSSTVSATRTLSLLPPWLYSVRLCDTRSLTGLTQTAWHFSQLWLPTWAAKRILRASFTDKSRSLWDGSKSGGQKENPKTQGHFKQHTSHTFSFHTIKASLCEEQNAAGAPGSPFSENTFSLYTDGPLSSFKDSDSMGCPSATAGNCTSLREWAAQSNLHKESQVGSALH